MDNPEPLNRTAPPNAIITKMKIHRLQSHFLTKGETGAEDKSIVDVRKKVVCSMGVWNVGQKSLSSARAFEADHDWAIMILCLPPLYLVSPLEVF